MRKLRSYALLALVILLVVVALQNLVTVEVSFLIWSMRLPRGILVLLCGLVGFGIGVGWSELRPKIKSDPRR